MISSSSSSSLSLLTPNAALTVAVAEDQDDEVEDPQQQTQPLLKELDNPQQPADDQQQHQTTTATTTTNRHLSVEQDVLEDDESSFFSCCSRKPPAALAWSKTTPFLAKLFIPLAIIATHYAFWYGQTADMWKLTQTVHADVSYAVTDTKAQVVFNTLKLPLQDEFHKHEIKDVRTFTYLYAIQELWRAKGMPGLFLPRLAACLLALFSGVWPHLKLFMLLVTWLVSKNPIRRKRTLASLSILGKWSLADVLVVCVMVGVLNLQFVFTASDIVEHSKQHLGLLVHLIHTAYSATDICSKALKYSCEDPSKMSHIVACKACRNTVNELFDHPGKAKFLFDGITTSGGGTGELYVAGLPGIYAFCGAVISSILLSLLVDWFDHKDREYQATLKREAERRRRLGGTVREVDEANIGLQCPPANHHQQQEDPLLEPLLVSLQPPATARPLTAMGNKEYRSEADMALDRQYMENQDRGQVSVLKGFAYITAAFVVCGVCSTTMERRVHGALPNLLHDILGVQFTKSYSFIQLARTTGLAGGWDILLLSTFCLFIIVGPLLRSILCVRAMLQKKSSSNMDLSYEDARRAKKRISTVIDFIGAFCAWEVFAAAIVMVDLLMPSITSTIIHDDRCHELMNDSTCFEVEFDVKKKTFLGLVAVGGVSLLLMSQHIRSKHY